MNSLREEIEFLESLQNIRIHDKNFTIKRKVSLIINLNESDTDTESENIKINKKLFKRKNK